MSYYRTCLHCGAHLDNSERCDCQTREEAPAGVANTGEGKVEQNFTAVSASIVHKGKEDSRPS